MFRDGIFLSLFSLGNMFKLLLFKVGNTLCNRLKNKPIIRPSDQANNGIEREKRDREGDAMRNKKKKLDI